MFCVSWNKLNTTKIKNARSDAEFGAHFSLKRIPYGSLPVLSSDLLHILKVNCRMTSPIDFEYTSDSITLRERLRYWDGTNMDFTILLYISVLFRICFKHFAHMHAYLVLRGCGCECMWFCMHEQSLTHPYVHQYACTKVIYLLEL